MPETIYLDLETTGLSPPDDEILEIAVVDDAGAVLLHSLVRPAHTTAWPDAEAIHGLTPADVQDAPVLEALGAGHAHSPLVRVVVRDYGVGLRQWCSVAHVVIRVEDGLLGSGTSRECD